MLNVCESIHAGVAWRSICRPRNRSPFAMTFLYGGWGSFGDVSRPEGISFNRHIAVSDICKSMQNSFPYSGSELWGSCSDARLNDSVIVSNALLLSKRQRKEAADDLRSVLPSLFSVRKEKSQRKLIQFPVLLQDVNETLMQMVTIQLEILWLNDLGSAVHILFLLF